jgi:uncharacterized membrane protein YtjA (UPF0391 family)
MRALLRWASLFAAVSVVTGLVGFSGVHTVVGLASKLLFFCSSLMVMVLLVAAFVVAPHARGSVGSRPRRQDRPGAAASSLAAKGDTSVPPSPDG